MTDEPVAGLRLARAGRLSRRRDRLLARIPMARFGRPDELVGAVLFLASDMSSYVTGTTINVDGGYLAV